MTKDPNWRLINLGCALLLTQLAGFARAQSPTPVTASPTPAAMVSPNPSASPLVLASPALSPSISPLASAMPGTSPKPITITTEDPTHKGDADIKPPQEGSSSKTKRSRSAKTSPSPKP